MTMTSETVVKTFKLGGDLEVNRLGFGAMRITGEGIWGEPRDPETAKKVLKRAVELGVNFIDMDSITRQRLERVLGVIRSRVVEDSADGSRGLSRKRAG